MSGRLDATGIAHSIPALSGARAAFLAARCALAVLIAPIASAGTAEQAGLRPALREKIAAFEPRIYDTVNATAHNARSRRTSAAARKARIEFVAGNVIFVAMHEMGHALISEMGIPVLGREEDAVDDFAILSALRVVSTEFSLSLLERAAESWFLMARRDKAVGEMPECYDRHGLDQQRAHQIICLMVGSDPLRLGAIASRSGMPDGRKRTCRWDFETASRAWGTATAPFMPKDDEPRTSISTAYGPSNGRLRFFEQSFRRVQLLEMLAEFFSDRYRWPAPISLDMQSCGESNASWRYAERRMVICYELAEEGAELYRRYGLKMAAPRGKP